MLKLGAAYIRTSVDKTGNKISPQQQYNAIKSFADHNTITLVNEGYYDEDVSSENFEDRPAFQQLLKDIDTYNITYLICYDSSRYTRVVKDFINMTTSLQERGVSIFFANSGKEVNLLDWNSNTMMDLIQSIFDQNMREDVRKKVSANMNELVDMGCYVGGTIPIGLSVEDVEIGGKKRKKYCLGDRSEIQLVKNIFKWYLEDDKSQSEIVRLADEEYADILNENELKKYRKKGTEENYKGIYFNSKKIWRILRNPSYTGYMVKNRRKRITKRRRADNPVEEWYWSKNFREGKEPDFTPIVPFETWEKVQQKLQERKPKQEHYDPQRENSPYLLSSMLKCNECGRAMNGTYTLGKEKKDGTRSKFYYYKCDVAIKSKGQNCSNKKMVRCEKVDNIVLDIFGNATVLLNVLKTLYSYQKDALENNTAYLEKINELENKIKKAEIAEQNVISSIGEATDPDFKMKLIRQGEELSKQIRQLRKQKNELNDEQEEQSMKKVELQEVVGLLLQPEIFYKNQTTKQVRNYLKHVIESIEYKPNKEIVINLKFAKKAMSITTIPTEKFNQLKEEIKTEKGRISKQKVKEQNQIVLFSLLSTLWDKDPNKIGKDEASIIKFIIEALEEFNGANEEWAYPKFSGTVAHGGSFVPLTREWNGLFLLFRNKE